MRCFLVRTFNLVLRNAQRRPGRARKVRCRETTQRQNIHNIQNATRCNNTRPDNCTATRPGHTSASTLWTARARNFTATRHRRVSARSCASNSPLSASESVSASATHGPGTLSPRDGWSAMHLSVGTQLLSSAACYAAANARAAVFHTVRVGLSTALEIAPPLPISVQRKRKAISIDLG